MEAFPFVGINIYYTLTHLHPIHFGCAPGEVGNGRRTPDSPGTKNGAILALGPILTFFGPNLTLGPILPLGIFLPLNHLPFGPNLPVGTHLPLGPDFPLDPDFPLGRNLPLGPSSDDQDPDAELLPLDSEDRNSYVLLPHSPMRTQRTSFMGQVNLNSLIT